MIDIHAHIIPGLDDGSQDIGTSMLMAEMAADSGVTKIIATPHCNQSGMYENYVSEKLLRYMDRFREEVEREDIGLKIGLGMEIFCSREVPRLLKEKKLLTLNGSRYVLVEFGFRVDSSRMERMLFPIMDAGFVPIIAHPERYFDLQDKPDIIDDWMHEGMGIQINKGSFFGRFGRDAYSFAHTLLRNGLVTCIASDAHGVESRTTDMTDILEFIATEYSEELADLLLVENPGRIFKDKPLLSGNDIRFY